jgi:hypothetical protein
MSGFRVAPRQRHLDRLKLICGYLSKMRQGCIRVRTDEPDYSDMSEAEYDWARTVYGQVKEELPENAPKVIGKTGGHDNDREISISCPTLLQPDTD